MLYGITTQSARIHDQGVVRGEIGDAVLISEQNSHHLSDHQCLMINMYYPGHSDMRIAETRLLTQGDN